MLNKVLASPLFVVEMEKVVMISDRLDQTMLGIQYVFHNEPIKAFEAMHEIAYKRSKKCIDAVNFSRVDPRIYSPPDYIASSDEPVSTKSIEKIEAAYVENERAALDMRLRRIMA